MHAHVVKAMKDLHLEGCTVSDTFYASGKHVRALSEGGTDLFFHPRDRNEKFPRLRYMIENVDKLEALPQELVRKYADIKVMSWQSELILSAFVRFTQTSDYLSVEAAYYVIPGLKGHYYNINTWHPRPTLHEFFGLVGESAKQTPLLWLTAPLRVARWMVRPIAIRRREHRVKQAIRENPKFDYGASGSIRESGSADTYGKYFQEMDIERFRKTIDQHLLTSMSEYLKAKGVDTKELEQRMSVIISADVLARSLREVS
jgi:hypothetical protein